MICRLTFLTSVAVFAACVAAVVTLVVAVTKVFLAASTFTAVALITDRWTTAFLANSLAAAAIFACAFARS